MFFHVDADTGSTISGWFAPDNPSLSATLTILVDGQQVATVIADIPRNDVREQGLHNTGHVGFRIDKAVLPNIDAATDLEVVETHSWLPIHRRLQKGQHIERRLFMFDASIMPRRNFQDQIRRYFSLCYFHSERNSLETNIVAISNSQASSIFMGGQLNYSRYNHFIETSAYVRSAILRNPFNELAERLVFLNFLFKSGKGALANSFATGMTPLFELARDIQWTDSKAALQCFRQLNDEQRKALTSPMVRMLGCELDEAVTHRHVSVALEHLASMDVVGTRENFGAFSALLRQTLGAGTFDIGVPNEFPTVETIATTLSKIGLVVDLLEHDLSLYSFATQAIDIGLKGQESNSQRANQAT